MLPAMVAEMLGVAQLTALSSLDVSDTRSVGRIA